MILCQAILFLLFTNINAHQNIISHPTCYLNPALRSLNSEKLEAGDILKAVAQPSFSSVSDHHRYEKPSQSIKLGYVTPWNGHGYDIAKWFASKLTHVSPVWYQLVLEDNMKPELRGGHDVDEGWLNELRGAYRPPKIVPRVQLQLSQKAAETILYYPQGQAEELADVLVEEVQKYGYDGVTLELPAPHVFVALIGRIGDALHDVEKELVLVIPPQHTDEQAGMVFGADHISELENEVDYFSVMTYDHAGALRTAGPNSPLPWMREVVQGLVGSNAEDDEEDPDFADLEEDSEAGRGHARKILMGLPYYGYKFDIGQQPEAYTSSNFLDFLGTEKSSRIKWDKDSKDHQVVTPKGAVYYPSLLGILYQLQLAEEMGVGIAIWELGQGLNHFTDIL